MTDAPQDRLPDRAFDTNSGLHFPAHSSYDSVGGGDMLHADSARIEWNTDKKKWHVVLQVGAEVIKRWVPHSHDAPDNSVLDLAVQVARDEGYELTTGQVTIVR
jgi:hypothetical protein